MTNLFGAGQEDSLGTVSSESVQAAPRFATSLLGPKSADTILSPDSQKSLVNALRALKPSPSATEDEVRAGLEDLGVLQNGEFAWTRIGEIGVILRENSHFRQFENRSAGSANARLRLSLDLRKKSAEKAA